jgi:hypothetical protein
MISMACFSIDVIYYPGREGRSTLPFVSSYHTRPHVTGHIARVGILLVAECVLVIELEGKEPIRVGPYMYWGHCNLDLGQKPIYHLATKS